MLSLGPVVIANLSGSTMETYVEGARLLDATGVSDDRAQHLVPER